MSPLNFYSKRIDSSFLVENNTCGIENMHPQLDNVM